MFNFISFSFKRFHFFCFLSIIIFIFVFGGPDISFFLPGVPPLHLRQGDELQVKASEISSTKRPHHPFDYYFLDFCKPPKYIKSVDNLVEIMMGNRSKTSAYTIGMKTDVTCKVACSKVFSAKSAGKFRGMINDKYQVSMFLDSLPSKDNGYLVGFKSKDDKYYINNHLSFKVSYYEETAAKSASIVGFEISPYSIKHKHAYVKSVEVIPEHLSCNRSNLPPHELKNEEEVIFTYDVHFVRSNINWAPRWDTTEENEETNWASIIASLSIHLFISIILASLINQTLQKEITKENPSRAERGTGWRAVHEHVFSPPPNTTLLSALTGTGIQCFCLTFLTIALAFTGRYFTFTDILHLWSYLGLVSGYSSSRLYKMVNGIHEKIAEHMTLFLFPAFFFFLIFILNGFVWGSKLLFTATLPLVLIWYSTSIRFVYFGFYIGGLRRGVAVPLHANLPRQIPEQAWYMKPSFTALAGGLLVFLVVYFEMYILLKSDWLNQHYQVLGYTLIASVLMFVMSAEISVILCYWQLCKEDYRWWWRAYLTSGSSGIFLFLYLVYYYIAYLEVVSIVSGAIYFVYALIVSCMFSMMSGAVGFYACRWFVLKMYLSMKLD